MNLEGVCVSPARAPGSNPNRLGQSKLSTVHREEMPMGMWGWGREGVVLQKYQREEKLPWVQLGKGKARTLDFEARRLKMGTKDGNGGLECHLWSFL